MIEGGSAKIDIANIPEWIRPYVEAEQSGTLPQYYLKRLKYFRDEWSDDLPSVDVRTLATLDEKGHFVGDKYKCRGNYIVGFSATLSAAIDDKIIKPELVKKIGNFQNHDFSFHHGKFTTQEEINMINQILAEVIQYLEVMIGNNTKEQILDVLKEKKKVGEIYEYQSSADKVPAKVVIKQIIVRKKKIRIEITRDLINGLNPFRADPEELM